MDQQEGAEHVQNFRAPATLACVMVRRLIGPSLPISCRIKPLQEAPLLAKRLLGRHRRCNKGRPSEFQGSCNEARACQVSHMLVDGGLIQMMLHCCVQVTLLADAELLAARPSECHRRCEEAQARQPGCFLVKTVSHPHGAYLTGSAHNFRTSQELQ